MEGLDPFSSRSGCQGGAKACSYVSRWERRVTTIGMRTCRLDAWGEQGISIVWSVSRRIVCVPSSLGNWFHWRVVVGKDVLHVPNDGDQISGETNDGAEDA